MLYPRNESTKKENLRTVIDFCGVVLKNKTFECFALCWLDTPLRREIVRMSCLCAKSERNLEPYTNSHAQLGGRD